MPLKHTINCDFLYKNLNTGQYEKINYDNEFETYDNNDIKYSYNLYDLYIIYKYNLIKLIKNIIYPEFNNTQNILVEEFRITQNQIRILLNNKFNNELKTILDNINYLISRACKEESYLIGTEKLGVILSKYLKA